MRPILLFMVGCLLLGQSTLLAQQLGKAKYGFFGMQAQQVNFNGFNRQIEDLGYPALPEVMAEYQGGMVWHDGRWRVGLGMNFASLNERLNQNSFGVRYEQIGLNYSTSFNIMKPTSDWFIGPEVNINLQAAFVSLSENPLVNNLNSAFEASSLRLNRLHSPLDWGVHIQKGLKFGNTENQLLVLGLRAGYRQNEDSDWRVNQAVDFVGSGLRAGGWYGAIHIGVGFWRPGKEGETERKINN